MINNELIQNDGSSIECETKESCGLTLVLKTIKSFISKCYNFFDI